MTVATPPSGEPSRSTMRAALLVGSGGPEMLEVRDNVPVPVPGPSDALIRVSACGMNNTDINTRVGWYSRAVDSATSEGGYVEASVDETAWSRTSLQFPRIQGADVVGRVVAVGPDVADTSLVGKRIIVDPCLRDPDDPSDRSGAGYLGSEADGGFAEFTAVPAVNVHPVNSELSDAELATFPCSSVTAEHMLSRIDLRNGQSIAVTGASGGVGSALVQLAKRRGARVVAVAGSSKIAQVLNIGADAAVARETPSAADAAVSANGGRFDAVADVVGGDSFAGWLDALTRGGRYVTAGAIGGPIVQLDLRTLYLNDLEFYGATIYEPGIFADLVGYIERGEIRPILGGTYPLEEIHAAQEAFGRKEHIGNLVITL